MKTAIVTGGTKGIGRAIALRLASQGYNLLISYARDDIHARTTEEECLQYTKNVLVMKADVAIREDVTNMVKAALDGFSSVDVLINNAAINIDKPLLEMSEDEWDRVVDINMKGVFLTSREVAGIMLKQDSGGHIINIGATTALKGRKNGVNYCASKAGVLIMTKCLAMELAPNIRVNCVIPGFTQTGETEARFNLPLRMKEELDRRNIPLSRIGQPDDVAGVVAFLLSREGNYINGQKIIVDGGEYMW